VLVEAIFTGCGAVPAARPADCQTRLDHGSHPEGAGHDGRLQAFAQLNGMID
jgi:hypothetical protein